MNAAASATASPDAIPTHDVAWLGPQIPFPRLEALDVEALHENGAEPKPRLYVADAY